MIQIEWIVERCNEVLFGYNKGQDTVSSLNVQELDRILVEAERHGVLPIVIQYFESKKIEDNSLKQLIIKWYGKTQIYRQNYQVRLLVMRELAEMFAKENLDVMFFKGAALAQIYPEPEWRVFSDIDFYLYGEWEKGVEVMERHGIKNRPCGHHNTEASSHGVLLENHYDFVERMNHQQNLVIDDELKKMAREEGRSMKATFLDDHLTNVYMMTPTMNAVFLMRHMSAHFVSESIPLRMLNDWIFFLKHHAKDVDWKRVTQLYEKSGMTEFVGIVMELIRQHFHITFPDVPIAPVSNEHIGKVWDSIVFPPETNLHKKYSIRYIVFETKTFWNNRWKHQIVYPGESYFLLSLHYAWFVIKKKLGLLKMKEG